MHFSRLSIPVAIFQFLICLPATQTQNKTTTQENAATQAATPKAINTPNPPYPEEAWKKGIEGKVTLLIVIDAKGKVSQAKALSGPKELIPASLTSVGEVMGNGRLLDKNGRLVAVVDDEYFHNPPYPETERKAGVAGNMILSITLGPDGHVKEIHAAKSLSPTLDGAAIDAVRSWRFKKVEGNPEDSLEDLRLRFIFRATCKPRF